MMETKGFLFVNLELSGLNRLSGLTGLMDMFKALASRYGVKAKIFAYNTSILHSKDLFAYIQHHNIDSVILCWDGQNKYRFDTLEIVQFATMNKNLQTIVLEPDFIEKRAELEKHIVHFRIERPFSDKDITNLFGKGALEYDINEKV